MTIKRKRAGDDSPFTPDTQSPSHYARGYDGAMDMETDMVMDMDMHTNTDTSSRSTTWTFATASRVKGSDWGHRTRKRFRDNRPDEDSIHGKPNPQSLCAPAATLQPTITNHTMTASTLNKLFAAQRDHPHATPTPTPTPTLTPIDSLAQPCRPVLFHPQKSTLHAFWKQLPAPPVRPHIFPLQPRHPPHTLLPRPQCDDCDAVLHSESGHLDSSMDMAVDVDMGDAAETSAFACHACGKRVCGTCAVVATRRFCLGCATSGGRGSRWW